MTAAWSCTTCGTENTRDLCLICGTARPAGEAEDPAGAEAEGRPLVPATVAQQAVGADGGAPERPAEPAGGADDALGDLDPTEEEIAAARDARRRRRRPPKSPTRNLVEWVAVVGGALVLALLIRTFVFQTFWIPSGSMSPTLVENDRVLVNKLSYRWGDPSRGDVIVFERPPGESGEIKDLIKRVIGLPGEHVSIHDDAVWIDGRRLNEPYTHDQPTLANVECSGGRTAGIDTEAGFQVPNGHVFVLGDNRTGSHDGRCFGPIDEDLIVGRAIAIIWPPSKMGRL